MAKIILKGVREGVLRVEVEISGYPGYTKASPLFGGWFKEAYGYESYEDLEDFHSKEEMLEKAPKWISEYDTKIIEVVADLEIGRPENQEVMKERVEAFNIEFVIEKPNVEAYKFVKGYCIWGEACEDLSLKVIKEIEAGYYSSTNDLGTSYPVKVTNRTGEVIWEK